MRWTSWCACCLKRRRAFGVLIAGISSGLLFSFVWSSGFKEDARDHTDLLAPLASVLAHQLNPVATEKLEGAGGLDTKGATDGANRIMSPPQLCSRVRRAEWIDCHPEPGADEQACARRNCCWVPHRSGRVTVRPACLMPPTSRRYVFSELLYDDHGAGWTFKLNDSGAVHRGDSEKLKVDLTYVAYHTARLQIRDPTAREFEPPLPQVNPERSNAIHAYRISRKGGALTFYSTRVEGQSLGVYLKSVFYANATRQVAIRIPSARLFYGLKGRHGAPFANASMWSRHTFFRPYSAEAQVDEGVFASVHPFVVIATNHSNITLGLFLHNSNDVVMTLSPARLATFRTSGGPLDFFFFFGTDPQSVVRQYLHIVGLPAMPSPVLLLQGLRVNRAPTLDGSFTSGKLPQSNNEAVESINSSISPAPVIRGAGGQPYRCHAPDQRNETVKFADFTHKLSSQQWLQVLQERFGDTSLKLDTAVLLRSPGCAANATGNEDTPPVGVFGTSRLQQSTYAEVRNTYTALLARETYRSFAKLSASIPMLLSESTFPGIGRWSGHWNPRLLSMESAVQGMLLHNILGMPVYGVAICEVKQPVGSKAGDNCGQMARQSAFFPVRRHNEERSGNVMGPERSPESMFQEVMAQANLQPSTLLPYTMTVLLRCSRDGDMLARPLFFEFPDEPSTHTYATQFMYGPHLLVVPLTVPPEERPAGTLEAYLPRGVWYQASDGRQLVSKGQPVLVTAPKGRVEAVFTRGGSIVPLSPESQYSFSGREISLVVSLDSDRRASGEFLQVASTHTNLEVLHTGRYSNLHFDFVQGRALIGFCSVCVNDTTLVSVRIYGLRWRPKSADINGRQLRFSVYPKFLDITDVNHDPVQPFLITLA